MMTERAQQIVEQKPKGWEYKLTAELLEAELPSIRARFDDLHRGLAIAPTKAMGSLEFMGFVRAQIHKLQVMLQQPELILQNELMRAWGPSGVAGDAAAIERAAAMFADACFQLYEWERDRQAVIPPADLEGVHQGMKGWAEHLFRQVDATILKLCPMLANPPSSGRFVFEMDFKAPANVAEVTRELEELDRKYHQQAQHGNIEGKDMAYRWTIEVRHEGLGKCRVISGTDKSLVEAKARAQQVEWEKKHQEVLTARRQKAWAIEEKHRVAERGRKEKLRVLEEREATRRELEGKVQEAEERTSEAQGHIELVRDILHAALKASCSIDWEKLKKHEPFYKPKPAQPAYLDCPREPKAGDLRYQPKFPQEPTSLPYPAEPQQNGVKYQPVFSLLDKLLKSRMGKKTQLAQTSYHADHNAWQEAIKQIDRQNQDRADASQKTKVEDQRRASELFQHDHVAWVESANSVRLENERRYTQKLAEAEQWEHEVREYQEKLATRNAAVDKRKASYETLEAEGVEDYCEMILANSAYPDSFPQDFDLEYNPETKILIVEYALPAPEHLPQLKEVKYNKSKDAFSDALLSEVELNKLYDEVLYKVCLRSLHELFAADVVNALAAISFNGWVKSVDKATGKEVNACILSVQVKKEELQAINLENVEPKTCFRSLKGVGSSKLHSLTPVAPVLAISREDKRFIAPREVVNQLNEGVNLAAMDWEDFEHLIRELFEQEFKQAGGEVKVTQASRDRGVDAVAFDPDVIRGGKTVIQAKRYTNTVDVSAVRDLYGTVLNEGASKGILVTTSDYGPDSYEFAKGKPLVLLSGANLLNLLEKHGHKAKIDLREAKRILGEQV